MINLLKKMGKKIYLTRTRPENIHLPDQRAEPVVQALIVG